MASRHQNTPAGTHAGKRRASHHVLLHCSTQDSVAGTPTPNDTGSAAVEDVLVVPAAMILFLTAMQFALYGLAAHAVSMAVAEGGAAARSANGGVVAATSLVTADSTALAGGLLISPAVSVREESGSQMVVDMSAQVLSIIPGVHLTVSATSVGPIQQFRATG